MYFVLCTFNLRICVDMYENDRMPQLKLRQRTTPDTKQMYFTLFTFNLRNRFDMYENDCMLSRAPSLTNHTSLTNYTEDLTEVMSTHHAGYKTNVFYTAHI